MEFKGKKVRVDMSGKYHNGRTAIQIVSAKSGEPYMVASVNVPLVHLEEDEVLIKDYSENAGVLKFLVENNIVEHDGRTIHEGWVEFALCKLCSK